MFETPVAQDMPEVFKFVWLDPSEQHSFLSHSQSQRSWCSTVLSFCISTRLSKANCFQTYDVISCWNGKLKNCLSRPTWCRENTPRPTFIPLWGVELYIFVPLNFTTWLYPWCLIQNLLVLRYCWYSIQICFIFLGTVSSGVYQIEVVEWLCVWLAYNTIFCKWFLQNYKRSEFQTLCANGVVWWMSTGCGQERHRVTKSLHLLPLMECTFPPILFLHRHPFSWLKPGLHSNAIACVACVA